MKWATWENVGVDLICEGLRLISKDDREAVERGRLVYDALYARLSSEQRACL